MPTDDVHGFDLHHQLMMRAVDPTNARVDGLVLTFGVLPLGRCRSEHCLNTLKPTIGGVNVLSKTGRTLNEIVILPRLRQWVRFTAKLEISAKAHQAPPQPTEGRPLALSKQNQFDCGKSKPSTFSSILRALGRVRDLQLMLKQVNQAMPPARVNLLDLQSQLMVCAIDPTHSSGNNFWI